MNINTFIYILYGILSMYPYNIYIPYQFLRILRGLFSLLGTDQSETSVNHPPPPIGSHSPQALSYWSTDRAVCARLPLALELGKFIYLLSP